MNIYINTSIWICNIYENKNIGLSKEYILEERVYEREEQSENTAYKSVVRPVIKNASEIATEGNRTLNSRVPSKKVQLHAIK